MLAVHRRCPWKRVISGILWVEPFDLFISCSRKDNAAGMVSALVETFETDFAQFSPSVPLKVFFDKKPSSTWSTGKTCSRRACGNPR